NTCGTDDCAARFEQELESKSPQGTGYGCCVFRSQAGEVIRAVAIVDSHAPAGIHVPDVVASLAKLPDKLRNAFHGCIERGEITNLRPDVNAHPRSLQVLRRGNVFVKLPRLPDRYSELVLMQSRRNVRMGISGNIRIHPHRNASIFLQASGRARNRIKFRRALQVEKQNACFQRGFHLGDCLAHTGEDDSFCRAAAHTRHSLQLAAGDYIKPTASEASSFKMLKFELALTE